MNESLKKVAREALNELLEKLPVECDIFDVIVQTTEHVDEPDLYCGGDYIASCGTEIINDYGAEIIGHLTAVGTPGEAHIEEIYHRKTTHSLNTEA
jgi:hypothetical protein